MSSADWGEGDDKQPDHQHAAAKRSDQPGWSTQNFGYLQADETQPARIGVIVPDVVRERDPRQPEARLEEAVGLSEAIDVNVLYSEVVTVKKLRPATYLGVGKLEELRAVAENLNIETWIFDCDLAPIQQRNLEKELHAKVIDRTGLILEIFGARASTREGELQVELAHLSYQRSRLVRSWTHLERQRGGAGFMGGPGETQIESDRRIIADKITRLKAQLREVERTRTLHRSQRKKAPYPVVALVGYTNAGKSTLFNRLTSAEVMAEDMLFATLDPTLRAVTLPSGRKVIMSDTVGFISNLPTMLVAAFRATLEEVLEADLILHVRDASHLDSDIQRDDVLEVLGELGVEIGGDCQQDEGEEVKQTRSLEVLNKADIMDTNAQEIALDKAISRGDAAALISAHTGEGCDRLLTQIDSMLGEEDIELCADIPYADGATVAFLHEKATILSSDMHETGGRYTFRIDPIRWARHLKSQK